MGLIVATKAFFKLLFNRELSETVEQLFSNPEKFKTPAIPDKTTPQPKAAPQKKPERSEAISLLAALQREARLVDLVTESLGEYSDEQIGSAAREVLEESGKVLKRMFDLQPATDVGDGEALSTPSSYDPAEYRLTGNVAGEPPFSGTVAHHGWKATKCEVPKWSGSKSAAMIVAPVEIEIG